jgi:hypothetical protein
MPRKKSSTTRNIALCYVRKSWTNKDKDKDDTTRTTASIRSVPNASAPHPGDL